MFAQMSGPSVIAITLAYNISRLTFQITSSVISQGHHEVFAIVTFMAPVRSTDISQNPHEFEHSSTLSPTVGRLRGQNISRNCAYSTVIYYKRTQLCCCATALQGLFLGSDSCRSIIVQPNKVRNSPVSPPPVWQSCSTYPWEGTPQRNKGFKKKV